VHTDADGPPPIDAAPGRTHDPTRAALGRYVRQAGAVTLLGVALAAGLTLLADGDHRRNAELLRDGGRALGVVESVHQSTNTRRLLFNRLAVRYESDGVPERITVWLGDSSRRYRPGEVVQVAYRVGDPSTGTVVGERDVAWWRVLLEVLAALAAILLIAEALVMWRWLGRCRGALRERGWVAHEYDVNIARFGSSLTLDDAGGGAPQFLSLKGSRGRLARFRSRPPRTVWTVADSRGRPIAAATPGPGALFMVRRFDPGWGTLRLAWNAVRPG
jgi:hypothetical protein